MALCSDITMGLYAVETLLLLHQSLFVQVVLNNAQAWSNMTKSGIVALERIQLKFLKRIFHAPSSTSNPITYLETGTLPIRYEIHIKQLVFLHHIITLHENDPVRKTYQQQLLYLAPNWANEVLQLREKYKLTEADAEIAELSKDTWKRKVKREVRGRALFDISKEANEQKTAQNLGPYNRL